MDPYKTAQNAISGLECAADTYSSAGVPFSPSSWLMTPSCIWGYLINRFAIKPPLINHPTVNNPQDGQTMIPRLEAVRRQPQISISPTGRLSCCLHARHRDSM